MDRGCRGEKKGGWGCERIIKFRLTGMVCGGQNVTGRGSKREFEQRKDLLVAYKELAVSLVMLATMC